MDKDGRGADRAPLGRSGWRRMASLEPGASESGGVALAHAKPAPISPRLSAALDVARGAAALYVVIHHLAHEHNWTQGVGIAFRFGQEAVIVFFLLSGFVIFANEHSRALQAWPYYWRRLLRIYPALLIAMAVSVLVALADHNFASLFRWRDLLGTLFSVQDIGSLKPGVIAEPFLGNVPLWSLSYEVLFYLIFPGVLAAWRRWGRPAEHAIGLACCLALIGYGLWPNHWLLVLSYFGIWWCGAMTAAAYMRGGRDFRSVGPSLWWLVALTAVAVGLVANVGSRGFGLYPVLLLRHFAVAALMVFFCFGPLGLWIARCSQFIAKPAAFVASMSYGLYVLHNPVLIQWSVTHSLPGLVVAGALLVALAYLSDRILTKVLARARRAFVAR